NKFYESIESCDIIVTSSGLATLECMLHKKHMLVIYKINAINYEIIKRLIKIKKVSLPNILSNEDLVSEFIQKDFNDKKITKYLHDYVNKKFDFKIKANIYKKIHINLRRQSQIQIYKLIRKFMLN
ncbi:MAG: hypothetical protein Q8O27_00660, partial [Enterobacteriaceae bacterium]|nr:hypothetical protein [Enterobacteriaceae bacterium]